MLLRYLRCLLRYLGRLFYKILLERRYYYFVKRVHGAVLLLGISAISLSIQWFQSARALNDLLNRLFDPVTPLSFLLTCGQSLSFLQSNSKQTYFGKKLGIFLM